MNIAPCDIYPMPNENQRAAARDLITTIAACQDECWSVDVELCDLSELHLSKHVDALVDAVLAAKALLLGRIKALENEVNEVCDDAESFENEPARPSMLGRY